MMSNIELLTHQKIDIDAFNKLSPEMSAIIFELVEYIYNNHRDIDLSYVPMNMNDIVTMISKNGRKSAIKNCKIFFECIDIIERKFKNDRFIANYVNKYYDMMGELYNISHDIHYFPLYILTANKWKYVKISRRYMPPDNGTF
jgi:glucan phosphorylase